MSKDYEVELAKNPKLRNELRTLQLLKMPKAAIARLCGIPEESIDVCLHILTVTEG